MINKTTLRLKNRKIVGKCNKSYGKMDNAVIMRVWDKENRH